MMNKAQPKQEGGGGAGGTAPETGEKILHRSPQGVLPEPTAGLLLRI